MTDMLHRDWFGESLEPDDPEGGNIDLGDSAQLQRSRGRYKGYPNAQKPPFVLKGDNLASMTFWHGKLLNEWANHWVS